MKRYCLRTTHGSYPIDPRIAEKYHLRLGMESPFTHSAIVDPAGNAGPAEEDPPKRELQQGHIGELANDGVTQIENGITLSQSEIIDFSQGVDSSNR